MNRQDRDRYDYGRYDDYKDDEHYHSARNLTNEFERDYQRHRGNRDDDRYSHRDSPRHSYHEGNDMEDTYQRLRRNEDSFRDRTDYMRDDSDSNRNYYGDSGRGSNDSDNYRGNMGVYRRDRDRHQDQGDRPLRSDNSGQYNPYNSNNYSRTRDQQDRGSDFGDGYRGTRYGGNSEYLSSDQQRDSRYNERSYRGGASYTGPYGSNENTRYSSGRDRDRDDRWYNSDRRRDDY